MLECRCIAKTGAAGCHGTAAGFRLVNPRRALQHRARLPEGGGGTVETAEYFVPLSSPCKPSAEGKLACDRGVLSGVSGISSELRLSNDMSFDASEHSSVEAWLYGLENGSAKGTAAPRDGFIVRDSTLTSGKRMIGEDRVRLWAP